MTTQNLILLFLANFLWIWGLYSMFKVEFKVDESPELGVIDDTKEVFWFVKYFAVTKLGKFWAKPVATCPKCMSGLHSTYFYWTVNLIFTDITWLTFAIYVLYVGCLVGFNSFAVLIYNKLSEE